MKTYRVNQVKNSELYVVQERYFWIWFTLSEPVKKELADGVVLLLTLPDRIKKLNRDYDRLEKRINALI